MPVVNGPDWGGVLDVQSVHELVLCQMGSSIVVTMDWSAPSTWECEAI